MKIYDFITLTFQELIGGFRHPYLVFFHGPITSIRFQKSSILFLEDFFFIGCLFDAYHVSEYPSHTTV